MGSGKGRSLTPVSSRDLLGGASLRTIIEPFIQNIKLFLAEKLLSQWEPAWALMCYVGTGRRCVLLCPAAVNSVQWKCASPPLGTPEPRPKPPRAISSNGSNVLAGKREHNQLQKTRIFPRERENRTEHNLKNQDFSAWTGFSNGTTSRTKNIYRVGRADGRRFVYGWTRVCYIYDGRTRANEGRGVPQNECFQVCNSRLAHAPSRS